MSSSTTRPQFDAFLARALENPEVRAEFEDAQARNALVDTLVRLRRRLRLTQTQIAKRMGVKQPTISGFETEGSDPRLSTLQRYARAVDAALVWALVPKREGARPEFYHHPDIQVRMDVNHRAPSERALSWVPRSVAYTRRHFGLAA